jgi:hypothetical protein
VAQYWLQIVAHFAVLINIYVFWNNCYGTYTFANGRKYVGDFKDGQFNGQGTSIFEDGEQYVGEWKNGSRHGQGTYTHRNGEQYVGDFKDGQFNGQGTFTYPDGDKYVGEFKDGSRHGQGTSTFANGDKYVGEFRYGWYYGQGTYTDTSGIKYVGEWKNSKFNGQGVYTDASGNKYVGEFKDDKYNGQGIFFTVSGAVEKSGIFANGKLVISQVIDPAIFTRILLDTNTQTAAAQATQNQLLKTEALEGTKENLSNCIGSVMVFSDGRESCTSSYSTLVRGSKGLNVALMSQHNNSFFAFASNMATYVYSHRYGAGRSQVSLAEAESAAINNCRRDCILLISAEPAGPLNVTLSEAEFHKTWPSDQLIYTRNVKMYGEAYAKSQLSAPLPQVQVQVEAKTELSDLEKALAEAEEAKRKQAELEAQLVAAQQQAQFKPTAPVGPRLRVHAMVIGNGAYQGSARLDNPINDARAMSAKLRQMGFKVTTVENATRSKLVRALVGFNRSASATDVSMFFYAGHAAQISGINYMLPTDINMNDLSEVPLHGISLNSVIDQYLPGKTKLVFLDACRDNPLLQVASRSMTRGLAPISVSEGVMIAYATKDGSVAADGNGKNSPFTKALLQHIDGPDDISVVLRKVRAAVMQDTDGKQQPWDYNSLTGGSLILSAIRAK